MTYYTHTQQPIGRFILKENSNHFEYSLNDEVDNYSKSMAENYPHRVWVGGYPHGSGWRYARVLKTVAHVVTDEADDGSPVVEKWELKSNITY
jgi:hypothetical protein